MAFTLPDLPYAKDALAPHISAETLDYHHGKHHNAYLTKLNSLIEGSEHANASLEDIVRSAEGGLFNQAAQVWNHSFYWKCMKPAGGGLPGSAVSSAINGAFGSFETFKEQFADAAATQFGSGWAWLVIKDGALAISKTANADTPLAQGQCPLLTIDVWEHAYYIDYRNARPSYISTFLDHLVNWDFVAENLAACSAKGCWTAS